MLAFLPIIELFVRAQSGERFALLMVSRTSLNDSALDAWGWSEPNHCRTTCIARLVVAVLFLVLLAAFALVALLLMVFGRRMVLLFVTESVTALVVTMVNHLLFVLVATAGDHLSLETVVLVGGVLDDAQHSVRVDDAARKSEAQVNIKGTLNTKIQRLTCIHRARHHHDESLCGSATPCSWDPPRRTQSDSPA